MKKFYIAIFSAFAIFASTHTNVEAFTTADIDLLVQLDVIEDTSLIPLLYLLAEDTPKPTTAELISAIEASKQETSTTAQSNNDDENSNEAVRVEIVKNISSSATIETNKIIANEETGVFTLTFDVTAVGNDFWIKDSASNTSGGFVYRINSDNSFNGSQIAFISDTTASEKRDDSYKISEDSTETFELTIEINPDDIAADDTYELQLRSLTYGNTSRSSGAYTFTLSDRSKFKTKRLLIKG